MSRIMICDKNVTEIVFIDHFLYIVYTTLKMKSQIILDINGLPQPHGIDWQS